MLLAPLLATACVALLLLDTSHAQEQPETVGDVADLLGVAEADRETQDPVELAIEDEVFRADLLRTLEDSHLTVEFADGSWFKLDADSEANVADYVADETALLKLAHGRVRVFVSKTFSRYDNAFRVQTDDAVIGVQGTFFIVTKLAGETTVYVVQGEVSVTSTDPRYPDPVVAEAGEFVRVEENSPPTEPETITQRSSSGQTPAVPDPGNWDPSDGTLPPDSPVPVPGPEPGASAPQSQSCICPKAGKWSGQNHLGEMACVGPFPMAMPLTPSSSSGMLEVRDDCATLVGSGFSEDEATVVMHRVEGCGYQGSVGGSQDGIPMTINFTWEVHDEEFITGDLKSTFSQQGMTCNMHRNFELRFSP